MRRRARQLALGCGRAAAHVAAAALLAALGASGCAYSFSSSSLPSHLKTIAVPVFENETLDGLIADEVTRGLSDRFLEDNRLKVARASVADCVLDGRVTYYERKVYSYTPSQEPESYIVVVRIAAVLKDNVKNRDLWTEERIEASATYPASGETSSSGTSGEATALPANEQEARARAIEKLAQDILARSLEQW